MPGVRCARRRSGCQHALVCGVDLRALQSAFSYKSCFNGESRGGDLGNAEVGALMCGFARRAGGAFCCPIASMRCFGQDRCRMQLLQVEPPAKGLQLYNNVTTLIQRAHAETSLTRMLEAA
eukprot:1434112-Amphidinium_carterae.2